MKLDSYWLGKNNRKYLTDVKGILWELQHRPLITNIDKRKLKKVVKNEQTIRSRVWKLKENNMKARFQERVKKVVNVNAPDILFHAFFVLIMAQFERFIIGELFDI